MTSLITKTLIFKQRNTLEILYESCGSVPPSLYFADAPGDGIGSVLKLTDVMGLI